MRLLVAAFAALALAPTAYAGGVTMVSRDVPLGRASARTLSGALPRFNLVALHWQGPGVPWFRTRSLGGRWSAWQAADDDWGRSGAWRKQGSPSWTGTADAIQYRLQGRVTRLRAYFLWSAPERMSLRRLSIAGSPAVIPRSAWAADEAIRRAPPKYADSLQLAIVHHTVNSNAYTRAQSAAIVRAIEVYHVRGNGWNDIGYNFLVDKYGQIFEGRYGGIDRNVIGAHALGFNTGSVGVAMIGTFSKVGIPPAAKQALERLLAWRLDVAHLDPLSVETVRSRGNPRFRAGTPVLLRAISGHRDTYFTDCPGNALYKQLPSIAKAVAALGLPKLYSPLVTGKLGRPVRFRGRLSSSSPWTVTVTDAAQQVVASGSGVGKSVDWTWNAALAAPGTYTWTMSAGPSVRPARGTIGGKAIPLRVTDLAALPAVTASAAQISYTLSVAATVNATLIDASGTTLALLYSAVQPAGEQSFTFTAPPSVPDGAYTIQLQVTTTEGQQVVVPIAIQIDRSAAEFSADSTAISPNGDGVQDSVTLTAVLAEPDVAWLQVLHDGVWLTTLTSGTYPAGTPITASWDGTIDGRPLPDGSYTLVLIAGSSTQTLPLVVDRRAPVLRPISWARLRFAVDEPATVSLVVGSTTYSKKVGTAGKVYFWLKERPRRYSVIARDAAGNVTRLTPP